METTNEPESERPDPRLFDAEITFSGLCVLRITRPGVWDEGRSRGPRKVDGLELLFARTDGDHRHGGHHTSGHRDHQHFPRLTYYAADHLALPRQSSDWPCNYQYLASPEGRELVSLDVSDKKVKIRRPFDYEKAPSTLLWCESSSDGTFPTAPRDPAEDFCLDWVLRDDQVGLRGLDEAQAVTRIEVPNGHWRTRGVYRNREVATLDPIRWRLVGGASAPEPIPEQALGRDLVLEMRRVLYGLTLRISNLDPEADPDPYDIVLTPGIDDRSRTDASAPRCLRLSLTNLPGTPSAPDVSHVRMYSDLSRQHPRDLREPAQADDVVCVGTLCDNIISFAR